MTLSDVAKQPVCIACQKPCSEGDRNTDGTYAHIECLRRHQVELVSKSDKGGNLYQGDR